ncbi:peptidase [Desulfosarcina widdelii]|uniref:Peptidase n=1 Tax=Desulfosarcina widdelii TaxID=947919 RepID=A0A5K7ZGK8_9BACT|nr:Xaa-Pro peptidase family protein [Desulfosarcina widdelii]BBO78813.1 peptidase [Desulfosarcina widdelii]
MDNAYRKRTVEFQKRLGEAGVDIAIIQDPDSVFYLSAFWGYLGMQFGRPTVLAVPDAGNCTIVTPSLEAEMAEKMSWIDTICQWSDGIDGEWRKCLQEITGVKKVKTIGIEANKTHPTVASYLRDHSHDADIVDISDILADMRMVKTADEIAVMRQAGEISVAMCQGAKEVIAEGVPEYEVALAVIAAGTRKAAEFLTDKGPERLFSPMIHNLQVLQSGGPDLSMVHRRPTTRRVKQGESVYMCFCEMNDFKGVKLGFDRQYWVGDVSDEEARLYEIAIKAQAAALNTIRPGVVAQDVHFAAEKVYREEGFGLCYRTGRAVGFSLIEKPELKKDDRTILQAGMTFAVDGAVSVPEKGAARVGDSIVVTDSGFDYLTPFAKDLQVL